LGFNFQYGNVLIFLLTFRKFNNFFIRIRYGLLLKVQLTFDRLELVHDLHLIAKILQGYYELSQFFVFLYVFLEFYWLVCSVKPQYCMRFEVLYLLITKKVFMEEVFAQNFKSLFVLYFYDFIHLACS
jgi:hypothetical protein